MTGSRRIRLTALAAALLAVLLGTLPRPRLEVHGLGLAANHPYSAPYEDLRLKRP